MLILLLTVFNQVHVFQNAKITTMDEKNPIAEVIVVDQGKILFVGNEVPEAYQKAPLTDLKGKWVLPGLTDAHAHYLGLGQSLEQLDLRNTRSFQEIIDMVGKSASQLKPGTWILGRGWDQNRWENKQFPVHNQLSSRSSNHPVCLKRVDGHALLLNQKAMDLLGLSTKTKVPEGGQILQKDGQLTGVFIDNAMELVSIPKASLEDMKRCFIKAGEHLLELGIIGVHDAGVSSNYLAAMEELAQAKELPIRVYAMLEQDAKTLDAELPKGLRINLYDGFLTVRCIKAYADGALGSRGAWLKKPYQDKPDQSGLQVTSDKAFDHILQRAKESGFQVATHAIGDQANRFVLDHYAQVMGPDLQEARFRIEHSQIVSPDDIPLFHQRGVIPSMQPTHCTSDMDWAGDRLGVDRLDGAYAWRSFLETGCYIPMGSDFPVEKPSPWDGLYSAITRQHQDGTPKGGFYPDQRLTRMEALKGFTLWAAKAAFQEDYAGSIQKGRRADFIVIDRDYFKVPVSEIPEIKVLKTFVAGKAVFEKNRIPRP